MIDNQFIKKPSGFNKQRLDSFVRSVKTNKQDVQKKELDEALELHTQLVAQDMAQRATQLPPFEELKQSYMDQAMQQMPEMPQAAYGMEIGAVMPSINSPFTYPSQQNITPPNSDMFKKNADKYAGKGMDAFKNVLSTTANAIVNPAIQKYNQDVYAKQQAALDAEETDAPEAKTGGDLIKAQTLGDIGNALKSAYEQAMANLKSDQPVYNEAGDLIDKNQLQEAATNAYNKYYQGVSEAYKNNPTPPMGGTDFSYLNQYPTMDGLDMPGYNLSGEGIAPELYKGTATAQMNTNMQADYPGLGRYFGLSPQKNLELGDVNYSPNYKAMYNDALSKDQYDRFETNIEANPTVAGSILDKLGVGKMFATRNYDVTQNILPQGESILDPERLAETQRRQSLLANEDMPGGGLFQTDEMDPYIWENRTRRDRRDVLQSAGIDPSRKNLRRLGEDYFENLKQDKIRTDAEASREGYENTLAAEEAAIKSGAARGSIGTRPRNPYDLMAKREGGTMLPMFQTDGEYPGIDWNMPSPFGQKQGPFNYDQSWKTQGLPDPNLYPDANKMQTFFDTGNAPLTGEAFGEQLNQYVPKYTGQDPQQLATATGKAKLTGNIAPTTYLTIGNAAGKYLADNIFGKDERDLAEKQYRASRFLENNLSLTAADTQFDPRLRGFDRSTDAFGGAPYAGAQVQYGQPLIARGQRGTEIPITMQEGGVYALTPEMIKQIIENGGEVEYMDNSNNFVNPFNQ